MDVTLHAVEVCGKDSTVLVLDAGTGIRRLGTHLSATTRVDILLSHLHMDHIQGLGFFRPLFNPRFTASTMWSIARRSLCACSVAFVRTPRVICIVRISHQTSSCSSKPTGRGVLGVGVARSGRLTPVRQPRFGHEMQRLSNTPACRHEASQKVSKEGYWEAEQI
jgi:hypothetical protein